MSTQANSLPPSLVNDISDIKRRLSAVERAPAPVTKFDRYPSTEWAAVGRGQVEGNSWSSCGIANVTGLVFDRIEAKFITDGIITGRSECEIRLAAFRHFGDAQVECVSASSTVRIVGEKDRYIGLGTIQWIHGIPFGWDYADDTTVYTIELQHRNPDDCLQTASQDGYDMFGAWKKQTDNAPASFSIKTFKDSNGNWADTGADANGGQANWSWLTVTDSGWDGSYGISNMHYCAGLPEVRLPKASHKGHFVYRGSKNIKKVRDPDIKEPVFS